MTALLTAPVRIAADDARCPVDRRTTLWSGLAVAWAVIFTVPHLVWAAGPKPGLGTSLSARAVHDGGLGLQLGCAGIALFTLAGAAVAFDAGFLRRLPRRLLVGLLWFGAVLLAARALDIYLEFGRALTGLTPIPADRRANYLHLSRWFLFGYLPWFTAGAVAWTGLAVRVTRRGHR